MLVWIDDVLLEEAAPEAGEVPGVHERTVLPPGVPPVAAQPRRSRRGRARSAGSCILIWSSGTALCGVGPTVPKKSRWWVSSTGAMTNTAPARGSVLPDRRDGHERHHVLGDAHVGSTVGGLAQRRRPQAVRGGLGLVGRRRLGEGVG